MNLLTAYKALKKLEPVFLTNEAASLLNVTPKYASTILSRLAEHKTIVRLVQGRWAYSDKINPLLLPSILTYPTPSYLSLYTALYYHGMIEQIPSVIYSISLKKTMVYSTPLAKISIHHIEARLFTGYETQGMHHILIATPEKALFDTLYLLPAKSNLFRKLTELTLPENFNQKKFKIWLPLMQNISRRNMIERSLDRILTSRDHHFFD